MNASTAAGCLLAAGLSWYLVGSDVLSSLLLRLSLADPSMPEPGAAARRSPQGVPYAELRHFVNADGLHLFCRYWEPAAPPRSVESGAGEPAFTAPPVESVPHGGGGASFEVFSFIKLRFEERVSIHVVAFCPGVT